MRLLLLATLWAPLVALFQAYNGPIDGNACIDLTVAGTSNITFTSPSNGTQDAIGIYQLALQTIGTGYSFSGSVALNGIAGTYVSECCPSSACDAFYYAANSAAFSECGLTWCGQENKWVHMTFPSIPIDQNTSATFAFTQPIPIVPNANGDPIFAISYALIPPSGSPTLTVSPTVSLSPSESRSSSATVSVSPTESSSPSQTLSKTPSVSRSPSETPSVSRSPSGSGTRPATSISSSESRSPSVSPSGICYSVGTQVGTVISLSSGWILVTTGINVTQAYGSGYISMGTFAGCSIVGSTCRCSYTQGSTVAGCGSKRNSYITYSYGATTDITYTNESPTCSYNFAGTIGIPPSFTATPTLTRTVSRSMSRSATPSSSFSSSRSPSRTESSSTSESPSPTPTSSETRTGGASSSQSSSFTPSATLSESATQTTSASPSETKTASSSGTASSSVTVTTTPSESTSQTITPSPSETKTASSSGTPSSSVTVTMTPSESVSQTITPSSSESSTQSPSITLSVTGSESVSQTITPSPSKTRTGSGSGTPSYSLSESSSASPSISMIYVTPTSTPLIYCIPYPSSTPTAESTPTSTPLYFITRYPSNATASASTSPFFMMIPYASSSPSSAPVSNQTLVTEPIDIRGIAIGSTVIGVAGLGSLLALYKYLRPLKEKKRAMQEPEVVIVQPEDKLAHICVNPADLLEITQLLQSLKKEFTVIEPNYS